MPSLRRVQVLAGGVSGLILTLGIARFAYTPLLPLMQQQTWLNDAAGGWLATFNYLGYMSGALLAANISSLQLKFKLYRIGLVIAILSTLGMAFTTDAVLWTLLRYLAGLSSAAGMLLSSGLVLNWLMRNGHRAELGVHFGGIGLGILASGLAVMAMLGRLDWDAQWLVLGAAGVLFAAPAWAWVPPPAPAAAAASPSASNGPAAASTPTSGAARFIAPPPPSARWMRLLIASYFCAGFGFVVSATFIVAMAAKQPALASTGGLAWVLVGLAAVPACFGWDHLARRMGELPALLLAYLAQIISIVLPALSDTAGMFVLAAMLYGATFIGIVSLTLALVGRAFPANPAKAMARLTLSYGVAQVLAPALCGQMAQASGNYRGALWLTAAVMLVGAVLLAALMREQATNQPPRS
ncbi:MAG: YbfB/YjiJ family MFS transporter [Leptothrix sp. (in: b-proteobacteria)]